MAADAAGDATADLGAEPGLFLELGECTELRVIRMKRFVEPLVVRGERRTDMHRAASRKPYRSANREHETYNPHPKPLVAARKKLAAHRRRRNTELRRRRSIASFRVRSTRRVAGAIPGRAGRHHGRSGHRVHSPDRAPTRPEPRGDGL